MCEREGGGRTCDSYGCEQQAVAWARFQAIDVDRHRVRWVMVDMDLCQADLDSLEADVDAGEAHIYEQIDYRQGTSYHEELTLTG